MSGRGLAAAIVVAILGDEETKEAEKQRRERSVWVRPLFENRESAGFFKDLNGMLRDNDPALFKNFVRMGADDFDYLVGLVTPTIIKKDTSFRKAIPVNERLAVTLRYLATGDSFSSLQFLFRMSKASICHIIEETCDALYKSLKDVHLKVSSFINNSNILQNNNSKFM